MSAELLSEVARHEERETKEPMTHPVNTRPPWTCSGPMNCLSAKRSQLFPLITAAGAASCDIVWKYGVSDC